jgi:hypothetical protein
MGRYEFERSSCRYHPAESKSIIDDSRQLDVAHHADDLKFLLIVVELHEFADRIFVLEISFERQP